MIAFFDSGVGGLSVWREVKKLIPGVDTVYFADTKNFPYGSKSTDEVCALSLSAVSGLMLYKPSVIVVACNTASTNALPQLRAAQTSVPIVGIVPAIKPASELTKTKTMAVCATAATLHSSAYHELKNQFTPTVNIIDQPCPDWVEMVERGEVDGSEVEKKVAAVVEPLLVKQVDVIVLGSTHYPFLRPVLEKIAGGRAAILDSGRAVAEQVQRVLANQHEVANHQEIFLCSGPNEEFNRVASRLLGRPVTAASFPQ